MKQNTENSGIFTTSELIINKLTDLIHDQNFIERHKKNSKNFVRNRVLSFKIKGGKKVADNFVNELNLISHLANVGDAKTLIIHPATTTHEQIIEAEQISAGVEPGLLRIS